MSAPDEQEVPSTPEERANFRPGSYDWINQRRRPQTAGRWQIGIAILCGGAILAGVAYLGLPRLFGKTSMQSWIEQGLASGVLNAVAGRQLRQQVAVQAEVQQLSVNQFLVSNAARFQDLQAGDTFIPEWKLPAGVNPLSFIETPQGRAYQRMALSVLEFEVEQLHIYQIRLGIRWSSTISPTGQFSLAFYQPYLDFLSNYRNPTTGAPVRVLLGVGPLKSPGWPETFVPKPPSSTAGMETAFIPIHDLPGNGATIPAQQPDSDLVSKSKAWLNTLMWQLSIWYPAIDYFQLDNEPKNRGGPRAWVMSSGYEAALAAIVLRYRPDASFLINWTGTANLAAPSTTIGQSSARQALRLAQVLTRHSVIQTMLSLRHRLLTVIARHGDSGQVTLGIDDYHLMPTNPELPTQVALDGKTYPVRLDTIAMVEIAEKLAGDRHPWQGLRDQGVPIEITELQAEPWSPFRSPGNQPQELLFELGRALQLIPPGQTTTVRFWRLSNVIYNLLYRPQQFADNAHPLVMHGPTGTFRANNQVELQIIAAVTGVSSVTTVDGQATMDNRQINRVISTYTKSR